MIGDPDADSWIRGPLESIIGFTGRGGGRNGSIKTNQMRSTGGREKGSEEAKWAALDSPLSYGYRIGCWETFVYQRSHSV